MKLMLFGASLLSLTLSILPATETWAARQSFRTAGGAESIQEKIDEAYGAHQKQIRIPAGTYLLRPPSRGPHLQFHGLNDFTIDATGAVFLFSDPARGGIKFSDCRNVTFRGATLRYLTLPFTQGVVTAIAPDGSFYDVKIDQSYPMNLDDSRYFPARPTGYLFDPQTRWWKEGTYDLTAKRVERLGASRFRFYWDRPSGPALHPVAVGDLMAFRGSGDAGLSIIRSAGMHISDITVLSAGGFAVWEDGGEGGNTYQFTVKRGPKPDGAAADPLFSSTADAFHSSNVRRGPVVEHSYMESMPDDGIAVHGTYSLVLEANKDLLVINKNSFLPDDPIRIYDSDGRPVAEAIVRSVTPLPDYRSKNKSSRVTREDTTAGTYFSLRLDRAVQGGFDYLAENPAATGSGYVLRYNTIRNHRARGMLLKAPNGLVEHNTIDGSTMGGIVVTPEFWWNEAGFSRDVIIRGNVVRHVAYAPEQLGGIVIAALNGSAPVAGYGHRHIILGDNTLEGINGVNLLITSSQDVEVRNNRFLHAQQELVKAAGASWGEDPGALIFVTESDAVSFAGNRVEDVGPWNHTLVESTPSAKVTGAESGVEAAQ